MVAASEKKYWDAIDVPVFKKFLEVVDMESTETGDSKQIGSAEEAALKEGFEGKISMHFILWVRSQRRNFFTRRVDTPMANAG